MIVFVDIILGCLIDWIGVRFWKLTLDSNVIICICSSTHSCSILASLDHRLDAVSWLEQVFSLFLVRLRVEAHLAFELTDRGCLVMSYCLAYFFGSVKSIEKFCHFFSSHNTTLWLWHIIEPFELSNVFFLRVDNFLFALVNLHGDVTVLGFFGLAA